MKEYIKYLKVKGLKKSSIKNYLWHTKQFLKWIDNRKISNDLLNKYFTHMLETYPRVNTINLRLMIVNDYLNYLNKKFKFDLLSSENTVPKILTDRQLDIFLNNPFKQNGMIATRDKALLELLCTSGLKVGQLINLKIKQLDTIKKELMIDGVIIKIPASTWFYLKKYLDERNDDIPYLFTNFDRSNKSSDKNLSVRSVERIINKYSKNINPPLTINPQILRNTLAYKLKLSGAESQDIKTSLHFKTKSGAKNYLKKIA